MVYHPTLESTSMLRPERENCTRPSCTTRAPKYALPGPLIKLMEFVIDRADLAPALQLPNARISLPCEKLR